MDENRIEGKGKEIKGEIKQAVGKATNNRSMQAEGTVDKAIGKVQGAFGRAKDEVRAEDRRKDEPKR